MPDIPSMISVQTDNEIDYKNMIETEKLFFLKNELKLNAHQNNLLNAPRTLNRAVKSIGPCAVDFECCYKTLGTPNVVVDDIRAQALGNVVETDHCMHMNRCKVHWDGYLCRFHPVCQCLQCLEM